MSTIKERVKIIKDVLKCPNQLALAEKMGTNEVRIKTLESGKAKSFKTEEIELLVENYDLDPYWLMTGKGNMNKNDTQSQQPDNNCELYHLVSIPQKVSAGLGETYHDDDTTTFPVCKNLFKTPINQKDYKVVEVVGDSMEPDIKDGAIAIFQEVVSFEDDGLYIIRKADELYVKRVIRQLNGDFLIQSDNKKYPDLTLPKGSDENLYIIGRVKAILPRIET